MPARTAKATAAGRNSRVATRTRPSTFTRMMRGIGRGVGSVWRLLARGVGSMVRAVGRGAAAARDIDSAHRRDGLALGLLAFAIICAVGSWFHAAGPVGEVIDRAVRTSFGLPGVVLPALLLGAALVLMRTQGDREHRTGRRW